MASPRILFVTTRPPWPPINGGFQRSALLYRALGQVGTVDVIIPGWPTAEPYIDTLREKYRLVGYFPEAEYELETPVERALAVIGPVRRSLENVGRFLPRNRRLRDWLTEHESEYDLVVARYSQALSQLPDELEQPIIVDFDDVDWELHLSQLNGARRRWTRRFRVRSESLLLERRVKSLLGRCAHVWVTKESDLAAVPHDRRSLLPNIPYTESDIAPPPLPPSAKKEVVFVGHLNFDVNMRALDHFVANVWPRIHARSPGSTFSIVGSHGEPATLARWTSQPGVVVRGFVEDLRDAYGPAAISISPIWEGAGTKIKVLESLTFGRVCVSTEHSARGLVDTLGRDSGLVVARTDDELVERSVEMLEDEAARHRRAAAGAEDVRRLFSFDAFAGIVRRDVARVLTPVR